MQNIRIDNYERSVVRSCDETGANLIGLAVQSVALQRGGSLLGYGYQESGTFPFTRCRSIRPLGFLPRTRGSTDQRNCLRGCPAQTRIRFVPKSLPMGEQRRDSCGQGKSHL